jgi:hypothetical protein
VPGVICRPQFVVGTVGVAVGLWGGPPRPAPFAALRASPFAVLRASSERSARVGGATTKYLIDTLNPTGYSQVVDELVNGLVSRTRMPS